MVYKMAYGVKVPAVGPQPARILLIGEAPGKNEEEACKPFIGASGNELTKMLNEAGILRTEVRITNVCKYRPPGNKIDLWWELHDKGKKKGQVKHIDPRVEEGLNELRTEIENTQPNIIVPLGNLPLWATTGNTGITKWRGSLLKLEREQHGESTDIRTIKVVPTIHPAAILRNWEWRYLAVHDFRRVKRWADHTGFPDINENFIIRPDYSVVVSTLNALLLRCQSGERLYLAVDIETRKRHLACLGIAWSKSEAICIPFIEGQRSYWSQQEELNVILLLRELLTHPNALCLGQNWQYDYQYIAKYFGFEVNLFLDTMSEHHVQFPGLPKGLDFQSSLYRDIHIYWKDDGKEQGHGSDDTWWTYNCRDCCATYEIAEVLLAARGQRGLKRTDYGTPYEIQQSLTLPVARASARGVKVDQKRKTEMMFMLQEDIRSAEDWLGRVVGLDFNTDGKPFNPNSNKQMARLFYHEMEQKPILHRKTKKPTLNGEALEVIEKRDILLRPLCQAINHIRSLRNCLSVCVQPLDNDNRLRCQYSIPGTETYRFASSSDPFGYGTNLQNITSGERAEKDWPMPNLRKIFVPDTGYTIGEFDLPQADARVVAWESGEQSLIDLFNDPTRHLHKENAEIIYGYVPAKTDPKYYYAKQAVHLTNYGGTDRVLAMTLGITVHEASRFQSRYFSARPKIKEWHRRIEMELAARRYVENAYGYRRFYFGRMEDLLKEALAWIPQSTVGIATNLAILNLHQDATIAKLAQFLLQVHDSHVWQWPTAWGNLLLPRMMKAMRVTVPYPQELVFQAGAKISDKSWGECTEVSAYV